MACITRVICSRCTALSNVKHVPLMRRHSLAQLASSAPLTTRSTHMRSKMRPDPSSLCITDNGIRPSSTVSMSVKVVHSSVKKTSEDPDVMLDASLSLETMPAMN